MVTSTPEPDSGTVLKGVTPGVLISTLSNSKPSSCPIGALSQNQNSTGTRQYGIAEVLVLECALIFRPRKLRLLVCPYR